MTDIPSGLETSKYRFQILQFHWDKWQTEARGFWKRSAVCSVVILLVILHQWGVVEWHIPWIQYHPSQNFELYLQILFLCPLSWFFVVFILHGFVDLMRHRVPDVVEDVIHNNTIDFGPFKKQIPLRKVGRSLYLLAFGLYFGTISIGVALTTLAVWYNAFGWHVVTIIICLVVIALLVMRRRAVLR
jgi:hypothetical protein